MNDFVVSSLKYRPKSFETVVGQDHVTGTLKNSIKENKIPSAILFCGPRGVGKTSCARIYAREINKSSIENIDSHDLSFNVFELDAASNRGIEEMKNLIDKVRIPPQIGKYKVYIIDEVHMLTTQAMNAFLKTLEEPPKHIVFVLATTEKNKILPTILSRCQIYDFNRISDVEIVETLINICKQEDFKFDDEALSIIARKSDGSLRDSLTILDRIVSFTNKNITTEKTSELLNVLDNESFLKLSQNIINCDLIPTLIQFNEICDKGYNEKEFLTGLANHFRNILIAKSKESHAIFDFNKNLLSSFVSQGEVIDKNQIVEIITIIEQSIFKYNQVENKKLLVEITLMKICKPKDNEVVITTKTQKKKIDLKTHDIEKTEDNSNHKESVKKEKETIVEEIPQVEEIKESEKKEISALSLSSLKLKKEVIDEKNKEKENAEKLSNEFNSEKLKLKWIQYSKNLSENGNNSLSSLLEINEPNIFQHNKIIFTVPSKSNKKEIDNDRENLIKFLRLELQNDLIELEVIVDKSTSKEYYSTPQEKFEKLNKINPLLDQFKKDLKLDL
jgi:DNA polymerase-3 subunit gamma/tau|tara:strand:+ start:450 stop:2132 length:1683 start_codon:yes stop_codon:yes gene_type:complete